MGEKQVVIREIEAALSELPPELREQVERCATVLRQVMAREGLVFEIALAVVGAENAADALALS